MALVRIPTRFYQDHIERDLPAPPLLWGLPMIKGAVIDTDHPDFAELVDDAQHYAHANGPDAAPPGLKQAAKALLAAVGRSRS